jgi:hypothetical protein
MPNFTHPIAETRSPHPVLTLPHKLCLLKLTKQDEVNLDTADKAESVLRSETAQSELMILDLEVCM